MQHKIILLIFSSFDYFEFYALAFSLETMYISNKIVSQAAIIAIKVNNAH